jgi:hypothetical protein
MKTSGANMKTSGANMKTSGANMKTSGANMKTSGAGLIVEAVTSIPIFGGFLLIHKITDIQHKSLSILWGIWFVFLFGLMVFVLTHLWAAAQQA